MSWRLFLIGVFLTPFVLVRPVATFGVSVGDVLLVLGGLGVVLSRLRDRDRPRRSGWLLVFAAPCAVLVVATLTSTLFNVEAALFGAVSLVGQYGLALLLVPAVLLGETADRVAVAARAFAYGFTAMVVVGLAITTFAPGLQVSLTGLGWMDLFANGRSGLFAGVGDLSKIAAMTIGVVYLLVMSRRVGVVQGGVMLGTCGVALIVARSASGVAAAAVAVAVLALAHLAYRVRIRDESPAAGGGRGLMIGLLGVLAAGVGLRQLAASGVNYQQAFLARVAEPLSSNGVEGVGSAAFRQQIAAQAWAQIGEHPLLGMGPGVFQQTSLYGSGVHVVPLQLWVELGLAAAVAWVVLILALSIVALRAFRTVPAAGVAAAGVLAATVVTHMAAPYMYGRALTLPIVLAVAAIAVGGLTRPEPEVIPRDDPAWPRRRRSSSRARTTSPGNRARPGRARR